MMLVAAIKMPNAFGCSSIGDESMITAGIIGLLKPAPNPTNPRKKIRISTFDENRKAPISETMARKAPAIRIFLGPNLFPRQPEAIIIDTIAIVLIDPSKVINPALGWNSFTIKGVISGITPPTSMLDIKNADRAEIMIIQ